MNIPKRFTKFFYLSLFIVLISAGCQQVARPVNPPDKGGKTACTQEAKLCPDGSSVGRVPPACEFAPCPTAASTTPGMSGSGIRGQVLLGPACPVMRDPPDPQCADKPYKVSLVVTTPDSSRAATSFSSDDAGKFSVSVPPGDYEIHSASGSQMPPLCRTGSIHVTQGSFTETTVYCDTGIR